MIQKLMEDGDPAVVDEIRNYLMDLGHWQIALITAFEKAGNEWTQQTWDRVSPAAIRNASKVSPSMFKMGMGKAELWSTFERVVRDLHPEVAADQFHQLVNAMTTTEFRRVGKAERKNK